MRLVDQLCRQEGRVLHVYPDSKGILTAGVGHNCESHNEGLCAGDVITEQQADAWLLRDLAAASRQLDEKFPWTRNLDSVRHDALVNMVFNMGIGNDAKGFSSFHHFLAHMEAGQFFQAADEMLNSKWANDVGAHLPDAHHPYGGRAWELSQQIKTGEYVSPFTV